jgi:hypothetical protein
LQQQQQLLLIGWLVGLSQPIACEQQSPYISMLSTGNKENDEATYVEEGAEVHELHGDAHILGGLIVEAPMKRTTLGGGGGAAPS